MSAGRITDRNLFLVGDIFVTILRTGHTLSIGVLRSTSASLNGVSHASVNTTVMKALRTTARSLGNFLWSLQIGLLLMRILYFCGMEGMLPLVQSSKDPLSPLNGSLSSLSRDLLLSP
jgi:hypothetical protein